MTEDTEVVFKFDEDKFLEDVRVYLESTYEAHYGSGKIQAVEYIQDVTGNLGFLQGCAIKYLSRFGKKEGFNKKDLYKAIHYIILLHYFSSQIEETKE